MTPGRGRLYALLAAVAWSIAGVLQRWLSLDVATLTSGRALFAALALMLLLAVSDRRNPLRSFASLGLPGVTVTLCLAVASSLFTFALQYATVARVLLLQAVAPVIAAVLARVFLREPVHARTWTAMALALAGVAVMVGGTSGGSALGDALALISAGAFALSVVVIRGHRSVSMVPATALSQVVVFAALAPFARWDAVSSRGWLLLAVFGVVQMAGGLAFFTAAARLLPVTDLTLLILLEVVLGPLWVWIAFAERPSPSTLIGGCGVVGAVILQGTRSRGTVTV